MNELATEQGVMRELALFAGVGGGILGGKILGWRTVCAVERDAYAAQVLAQRQNDGSLEPFPIWSDVCSFDGRPWRGIVDVISGGFPCQGYSTAARGRNCAESFLSDYWRIVAEVSPRFVFAENVTRSAIQECSAGLRGLGYNTRMVALSAKDVGADHIRPRFWLLAYTDQDRELFRAVNAKASMLPELCGSVWQTFPDELRVADGASVGMDGARAAGDAQVPLCMATAWQILGGSLE